MIPGKINKLLRLATSLYFNYLLEQGLSCYIGKFQVCSVLECELNPEYIPIQSCPKLDLFFTNISHQYYCFYFISVLSDSISRAQIKLTDVADTLQGDWVILAQQLDVTGPEINQIKSDYNTVNDQALAMLQLWVEKKGEEATGEFISLHNDTISDMLKLNALTDDERVDQILKRVVVKVETFWENG